MHLDFEAYIFIPGAFFLLNNKTEFIYTQILTYLKIKLLEINNKELLLETATCDFEQSLINAINNVFPEIILVWCYFHHKKALMRNATKLGLCNKELIIETEKLINKELGILPFKNFEYKKDFINKVETYKKEFQKHTEFINYYLKKWTKFFDNKMLDYSRVPKKIRTISNLENYNGQLLKLTNKKKNLTWPEYVNLLINEEHKFKLRTLNIISKPLDSKK